MSRERVLQVFGVYLCPALALDGGDVIKDNILYIYLSAESTIRGCHASIISLQVNDWDILRIHRQAPMGGGNLILDCCHSHSDQRWDNRKTKALRLIIGA